MTLEPTYTTEVNGIVGVTKPKGIDTIVLEIEDKNGKIYKLKYEKCLLFSWCNQAPHLPPKMVIEEMKN